MDLTYPEKFHKAAAYFDYIFGNGEEANTLSSTRKLMFYALRCQAEHGACTTPAPSRWHRNEWYKYNAWKKLSSMSKEEAMVHFVNELEIELQEHDTLPEVCASLPSPIRWADVQFPSVNIQDGNSSDANVCNEMENSVNNDNRNSTVNDTNTNLETQHTTDVKNNLIRCAADNSNSTVHHDLRVNNVVDKSHSDNHNWESNLCSTYVNTNANANTLISSKSQQKMFKVEEQEQQEEQQQEYTHNNKVIDNATVKSSKNEMNAKNEILSHTDLSCEFEKWDEDVREHCDVSEANIYYLASELMQARWANRRMLTTIQNLHDELDERNRRIDNNSHHSSTNHTKSSTRSQLLSSYTNEGRHVAIPTEELVIKTISPFDQTHWVEMNRVDHKHEQEKKVNNHELCNTAQQSPLLKKTNIQKPKQMTSTNKEKKKKNVGNDNNLYHETESQPNNETELVAAANDGSNSNLVKHDVALQSECMNSNIVSPAEEHTASNVSKACGYVTDTQNELHKETGSSGEVDEGNTKELTTNNMETEKHKRCDEERQGKNIEGNEDQGPSGEQMKEEIVSTPATTTQEEAISWWS